MRILTNQRLMIQRFHLLMCRFYLCLLQHLMQLANEHSTSFRLTLVLLIYAREFPGLNYYFSRNRNVIRLCIYFEMGTFDCYTTVLIVTNWTSCSPTTRQLSDFTHFVVDLFTCNHCRHDIVGRGWERACFSEPSLRYGSFCGAIMTMQ